MLILVKTPTITFSLDVQPDDSTEVLFNKVAERTEYKRFQFDLLFAGSPLSKGSISGCGVKKESTVHMTIIKELKFTIKYKDIDYPLSVPNNQGLQLSHLIQAIKTQLRDSIPDLKNGNVYIHNPGNPTRLANSYMLHEYFGNYATVEISIEVYARHEPVAPVYTKTSSPSYSHSASSSFKAPSSVDYRDSYSTPAPVKEVEEQFDQDALLNSFVESSISSDVEIVFCFDTTGSMSSIIKNVKTQVESTVARLMRDIPNIRIGIMGMGDYCDGKLVLSTLDLTQNTDELIRFIKSVQDTSGGDSPEAYEYALFRAKEMTWSQHTSKAFVMIGDSNPHPPSFTNMNINWFKECDDLYEKGVKIYGVKALGNSVFYDEIAERTGGICINFKKFNLITEMFLAICYREASKQKFKQYEQELNKQADSDLKEILQDLNKENFTVESTSGTPAAATTSPTSPETTTTTTTSSVNTNTPYVEEPAALPTGKKIKKTYGKPSEMKNSEPWFMIHKDYGQALYFFNPDLGYFENKRTIAERETKMGKVKYEAYNQPHRSNGSYSSSSEESITPPITRKSNVTPTPTPTPAPTPAPAPTPTAAPVLTAADKSNAGNIFQFDYQLNSSPIDICKQVFIIGDKKIGKTTFCNAISFVCKSYSNALVYKDSAVITAAAFQNAACFIVCLDLTDSGAMTNLPNYFSEIRRREMNKPIFVVGLKSDGVISPTSASNFLGMKAVYSIQDTFQFSQYMKHEEIKSIDETIRKKLTGSTSGSKSGGSKNCNIM